MERDRKQELAGLLQEHAAGKTGLEGAIAGERAAGAELLAAVVEALAPHLPDLDSPAGVDIADWNPRGRALLLGSAPPNWRLWAVACDGGRLALVETAGAESSARTRREVTPAEAAADWDVADIFGVLCAAIARQTAGLARREAQIREFSARVEATLRFVWGRAPKGER